LTTEEKDSVNLLPHFIIGNNLTALKAAEEKVLIIWFNDAESSNFNFEGRSWPGRYIHSFLLAIFNLNIQKSKLYILGAKPL